MSETQQSEVERGPNGFPYIDDVKLSQWESGGYHVKVVRSDGERVDANLKPEQFESLVELVKHIEEGSDGGGDL